MKKSTKNPTVTEVRDLMSRQLRRLASELKAKEVKITSEYMDDLSTIAKYYALFSETINANKVEEIINLMAFRKSMSSIYLLHSEIVSGEVKSELNNIDVLLGKYEDLVEGEEVSLEADDDAKDRLLNIVQEFEDDCRRSELVSVMNTSLKFTSSVFNSFAHSKETMEDTANWFVKKSANLVNKVADVIGQEESPERSSADIMLILKDSLRERCSTKKEAPDLKVVRRRKSHI